MIIDVNMFFQLKWKNNKVVNLLVVRYVVTIVSRVIDSRINIMDYKCVVEVRRSWLGTAENFTM